jgi:endonuclease VIII
MPEGHRIHRFARLQGQALRGKTIAADSPQGRFAAGAAVIDGQCLDDIEAFGKHLFYRWSKGDTLHVHLGLYGRFSVHRPRETAPTPGTRLRLVSDEHELHLAGPSACDLVDVAMEDRIVSRLGPDPLRGDADPERAWAALRRRTIPISAALLDQKVMCGVGNVYRAEVLFLEGIHPFLPARELGRSQFDTLWATLVALMTEGERTDRIVTTDPGEVPVGEHLYVYGRAGLPCHRCGTPIRQGESALRSIFWCPHDQPEER